MTLTSSITRLDSYLARMLRSRSEDSRAISPFLLSRGNDDEEEEEEDEEEEEEEEAR